MKQVVVTGFSALTPFGKTSSDFSTKMFGGESAVGPFSSSDPNFPIHCAGIVPPEIYPDLAKNLFTREIEIQLDELFANLSDEPWLPVDAMVFGTSDDQMDHGTDYALTLLAAKGQPPLSGAGVGAFSHNIRSAAQNSRTPGISIAWAQADGEAMPAAATAAAAAKLCFGVGEASSWAGHGSGSHCRSSHGAGSPRRPLRRRARPGDPPPGRHSAAASCPSPIPIVRL